MGSFKFQNAPLSGLVTDLNNDAVQDIFWNRVSDVQIKGYLDAGLTQLAVTLDLSAPTSIAAGAMDSVTVTMSLSDNLKHVTGNVDQLSSIGSVDVVAQDTDGDPVSGTVNLTVRDDVPTAHADDARSVAEDAVGTIGGNVMTPSLADDADQSGKDVPGADGATLTAVNLNDGNGFQAVAAAGTTTLSTANGTYTFKADGTWTFDPNNNLNNASGVSAGFTYRITDGDGDPSEAVQPITVTDGTPAVNAQPQSNRSSKPSGSMTSTWTPVSASSWHAWPIVLSIGLTTAAAELGS